MSEPFIGEIRMFGFQFAPRGWATCDGQLLPISQNSALFSLLGTIYGGDGRTTFALPDLRGRSPLHQGSGPGLTPRQIGNRGGAEQETLSSNQMPSHNHGFNISSSFGNIDSGSGALISTPGSSVFVNGSPANVTLAASTISNTGGSQPHNNMAPYLTINFCIALMGIFPSRN